MNKNHKNRLLIFIVAYNAEHHIEKVLNRIPEQVFTDFDYEILIIDDSSADKTFEVAHGYKEINHAKNIRVLYNPVNQGYGGNQKLGYRYAIQNNFDVVLLLHGDGQYAPEIMPEMINPIFSGEADAVFGSRMLDKGGALKGGMPFYKYVGNKILTTFQNKLLNSNLSEFHTGYRAYSVEALNEIPFEANSNDFHFDTHIIIQLILAKKRIVEIPIPTYYGDEICHVNGIKYGWDVIKATLASKLHQLSIYYKREYDIEKADEEYDIKLGYTSSHTMAINAVAGNSTVIDIGGGQGKVAKELKAKSCTVTGIDKRPLSVKSNYDKFYQIDIDQDEIEINMAEFDYVLILDIIEHLSNPELFLDQMRVNFGLSQPKIILTTPNIAFFILRFQLFTGNFNYGKQGILDKTHKRLFTFQSIKRLCIQCGYTIEKVKGIPAPFPKAIGRNIASRFLMGVNRGLIFFSKKMFSYQIYMELKPTPVVTNLLEYSVVESAKKAEGLKG